jgi:hypothetical protein
MFMIAQADNDGGSELMTIALFAYARPEHLREGNSMSAREFVPIDFDVRGRSKRCRVGEASGIGENAFAYGGLVRGVADPRQDYLGRKKRGGLDERISRRS